MRQVKASKTKLDVSEQIFDATDRLMAKEGLHHLSMHKLAKGKQASQQVRFIFILRVKTSYWHNLLVECSISLLWRLKKVLMKINLFRTIQKMWWNIWHFLQENPKILSNMNQYQSLPEFIEICKKMEHSCWDQFCIKGQAANVLLI